MGRQFFGSRSVSALLLELPSSGFNFSKAVVAIDVAHGDVARRFNYGCGESSLNLGDHVPQKFVLDSHTQHTATDHEPQNISIENDGSPGESMIAEAVRNI